MICRFLYNYNVFTFSERYNGVRNGTNQQPTNQAKGQRFATYAVSHKHEHIYPWALHISRLALFAFFNTSV